MSDSEAPKKKPRGRPELAENKRTVPTTFRLDPALKTETERLALELARRDGTVREITDRTTGERVEAGNVTAYVQEALRRENARIARLLAKEA